MGTKTRSIIGVFEDYATATRVRDQLMHNGFRASELEIAASDAYTRDVARGNAGLGGAATDVSGGGLTSFFRRLFGADDADTYAARYSDAVRRGNALLSVTTDDEDKQDRAVKLLDRSGAMDVAEIAGVPTREAERAGESINLRDRHKAIRPANDDDIRMRDEEVEVRRVGEEPSDDDFRKHFVSRYGNTRGVTYEMYAPAYRYGYEMGGDSRYRSRPWEDVEPALRSDYERRYPTTTWEQMKESIRYGWDKVTGRK